MVIYTYTHIYLHKHTTCILEISFIFKLMLMVKISFQTFFIWALLLIVPFEVISSGCNALVVVFQQLLEGPTEVLVWACQWPSSQPLSSPQLSHNDSLWAWGITKSQRKQGLDYREAEELSWCPSCSNSLWHGWGCGLVHCPAGNATEPIWRVLASSDGISSWTPLKHQHSNHNPNPINSGVLTSLLLTHLSSSFTDSLPSLNLLCHSKTDAWIMRDGPKAVWSIPFVSVAFFPSLKQNFIVLLKCHHIQIAFLKFTSCDNQALVGCIPISAVAVHFNLRL